jgi:hypothetical protein
MLKEEDKYLILCSDGLTEFIGNDEMVSMVHKYAEKGLTPHEIAKRLVRPSPPSSTNRYSHLHITHTCDFAFRDFLSPFNGFIMGILY